MMSRPIPHFALALSLLMAIAVPAQRGEPFTIEDQWQWRLRVDGEVEHRLLLNLDDVRLRLPTRLATQRLTAPDGQHTVATWSGLHISTIIQFAIPDPDARYLHITSVDGHRDCYTVADLMRPRALFAHTRDGLVLGPENGGPLRLVLPWRDTTRCPVAIERIEFSDHPIPGIDPLRGPLPEGEVFERGYPGQPTDPWSPEVAEIEFAEQSPMMAPSGPWGPLPNPWGTPTVDTANLLARVFVEPSFQDANSARTHLVWLGEPGLSALDPDRPWETTVCPLTAPQIQARVYSHNVLAEIDDPRANLWTLQNLNDSSPLVAAMALDTLTRRGDTDALQTALRSLNHPDNGLALTAISSVAALAEPGDFNSQNALQGALQELESNDSLPEADRRARLAEIERALLMLDDTRQAY
jgi:DMSO/TMAO reductase YedYZ molybdopterin-dependent catalytic subunit